MPHTLRLATLKGALKQKLLLAGRPSCWPTSSIKAEKQNAQTTKPKPAYLYLYCCYDVNLAVS